MRIWGIILTCARDMAVFCSPLSDFRNKKTWVVASFYSFTSYSMLSLFFQKSMNEDDQCILALKKLLFLDAKVQKKVTANFWWSSWLSDIRMVSSNTHEDWIVLNRDDAHRTYRYSRGEATPEIFKINFVLRMMGPNLREGFWQHVSVEWVKGEVEMKYMGDFYMKQAVSRREEACIARKSKYLRTSLFKTALIWNRTLKNNKTLTWVEFLPRSVLEPSLMQKII